MDTTGTTPQIPTTSTTTNGSTDDGNTEGADTTEGSTTDGPGEESSSSGEPEPPPMNIAFVTSTSHDGSFGGIAAADTICSDAAMAAGLEGEFIAFLGISSAENARLRLEGARGWVRTDGLPVLDLPTDDLLYPLRINELGEDVGGDVEVWTGYRRVAVTPLATCEDWTSSSVGAEGTIGYADAVATTFRDSGRDPCSFARRLYCFEIDHDMPVELPEVTGRTAFLADTSWDGFGGIDVADNICQTQADMAGLSGLYLAALSGTTASARSRFDLTGDPWVRPDRLALAPTAAAFFDQALWDIPLHMEADGTVPSTSQTTWTGPDWNSTGSSGQTCANWEGSVGNGLAGRSAYSDKNVAIASVDIDDCDDSGANLYCLQQ